jgi:hypothetical protein
MFTHRVTEMIVLFTMQLQSALSFKSLLTTRPRTTVEVFHMWVFVEVCTTKKETVLESVWSASSLHKNNFCSQLWTLKILERAMTNMFLRCRRSKLSLICEYFSDCCNSNFIENIQLFVGCGVLNFNVERNLLHFRKFDEFTSSFCKKRSRQKENWIVF